MNKNILLGLLLLLVCQVAVWYQTHSQFFIPWAKNNILIISLFGFPVSYLFIISYRYLIKGFDGMLWPSKLIGFATGMLIMGALTYIHMNQGLNLKTGVTLILALLIVLIQIFWK